MQQQHWQDSGLSGETKGFSQIHSQTDVLTHNINFSIFSIHLQEIDSNSRLTKKGPAHGDEMLPQGPANLIQGSCYQ